MSQVGRYQLIRELATGGMAKVYLAKAAGPAGFSKTLVLKRILPELTRDPHFVQMFLSEARLAALLNHPNIVQIYELGEAAGSYFIAMEYIDGPNLRTLTRCAREQERLLPMAASARIVAQVCEGLGYAHAFRDPETGEALGLVHRDVSPDNILVTRSGVVKVVDFGIAKATCDRSHLTKAGSLKGKLSYMPPEQIKGEPIDQRADIYALGMVLYQLLTGQRAYNRPTSGEKPSDAQIMHAILFEPLVPVAERRPEVPEVLQLIVGRCLAKNREERYRDCRELQTDLEAFIRLSGEQVGMPQLAQLVEELVGAPVPLELRKTPPRGTLRASTAELVLEVEPFLESPAAAAGQLPPPVDLETHAAPQPPQLTRPPPLPPHPAPRPLGVASAKRSSAARPAAAGGKRGWLVAAVAASLLLSGSAIVARREGGAMEAFFPVAAQAPLPAHATLSSPLPAAERAAAPDEASGEAASESPGDAAGEAADEAASATPGAAQPEPVQARRAASRLAGLEVECNVPAEVRINGRAVGSAPLRLRNLQPGRVRVEVLDRAKGFSKQETVRLRAGDTVQQRFSVEQGTLEFRIRPYATVILDGKTLGQTPLTVSAWEGSHQITLVNRDLGKEIKLTQVVKPGQLTVVKYVLDE